MDLAEVRLRMGGVPAPTWVWCAHCETSTGVLNDIDALKELCAEHGVKLCLDCISSIGTMAVDLSGVCLASGASGKGLRSYPGVAMVFYHHEPQPAPDRLPRYLDLGFYAEQEGIPFTFSSNLLHALHAAIKHVDWERRFTGLVEMSTSLRTKLLEMGFTLVAKDTRTSPAVVTIHLPPELDSMKIGGLMQEAGYLLSCHSGYLRQRNWIQICLMGECTHEKVISVANALNRVCFKRRTATTPTAQTHAVATPR